MKKIFRLFILSTLALSVFSCEHYLDINENPNDATSSSPQQVLPNALTNTAAMTVTYNDYGSWHVGYIANAGGFGGWGSTLTYNYTTNEYNALWNTAYDNLNDYRYIEKSSGSAGQLAYFNAVAKIMIAYNFQMLVDAYGDVPYTDALAGSDIVTPTYDKAEDIYKDLIENKLDSAVYIIENATNANSITASDVVFKGDMSRWLRLANTLKLKALVRVAQAPALAAYATAEFSNFGSNASFLTDDAIVNPGYITSAGKQNPFWNMYHTTAAGAAAGAGRSRLPSEFVLKFYNGTKIEDAARGEAIYRSFPNTPSNALGNESANAKTAPSGHNAWDTENSVGLFKGSGMGQPIFLAAESYFLLAEAYMRGYLTGDASAAFRNGIVSSYTYLYKNANGNVAADYTPVADADAYIAANTGNPLVNYSLATSTQEKLEAIITQKYIALNFIHGHEAWNEFRRTGYPKITSSSTFASIKSTSTREDKLPVRILYPSSEYQVNPKNAPTGVNVFSTTLFWDLN